MATPGGDSKGWGGVGGLLAGFSGSLAEGRQRTQMSKVGKEELGDRISRMIRYPGWGRGSF